MTLKMKRIYAPPQAQDGFRILVDRLWPRGISKADARVDLWLKEIAPSTELRQWFGHDRAKFDEFARRYRAELEDNPALQELRRALGEHPTVSLLYAAKDDTANQAAVLKALLDGSPSVD